MITVRPGRPDDRDILTRFSLGVGAEAEGLKPDVMEVRAAVGAALADRSKARYFVAEADGVTVGGLFVTYEWSDWSNGWYWWIQGVYVEPAWRGKGVLDNLGAAVRRAARDAGDVRRIRLYVHQDNQVAIAAYERMGFQRLPDLMYDVAVE